MTTDDLRTRAREAAEARWPTLTEPHSPVEWHDTGMNSGFVLGALWYAAQQPSREEVRDELAHWPVGHGYEPASVSIDDAGDMADAVLALFDGAGS